MNIYFLLAQICGILSFLVALIAMWNKTKEKIMFFSFFANILALSQFIFLGAITGVCMSLIASLRIIVYYYFSKKNIKPNILVLLFFSLLISFFGIYTYESVYSIFPIISMLLTGFFLWPQKTSVLRLGGSISSFLWVIYDITVQAYAGIFSDLLMALSTLISFFKYQRQCKK